MPLNVVFYNIITFKTIQVENSSTNYSLTLIEVLIKDRFTSVLKQQTVVTATGLKTNLSHKRIISTYVGFYNFGVLNSEN